MTEVPAEVVEAATTAWAVALKASINGRDVDYLGAARNAAIAVAYAAGCRAGLRARTDDGLNGRDEGELAELAAMSLAEVSDA